ncbi:MAG: hypothetical protein H7Z13_16850 [Ferruginibacter sp.]|nr:hypothetical protein [Ferruginibacter sp.]
MKKLICGFAIAALGALSAKAQDGERIFKRFKGDVSLGYAAAVGGDTDGGVTFALEPKFGVMDNLSFGLRMEGAVLAKFGGTNPDGTTQIDDAKAILSFLATADYYFTTNYSFRPFAGAGAGIYGIASDSYESHAGLGAIFRIGAEVKHFRFGVEYNFISGKDLTAYTTDNTGSVILTKVKSKDAYIGIKAGFCFGGGLR